MANLHSCRGKVFIERRLHHAGHPWSASAHHYALLSGHGAAVSSTRAQTHTPRRFSHFKAASWEPVCLSLSFFFSVNEESTCYTGALCGLGCNSQVQEGILPEHDIELTFDVKFDVEDIIEVTHRLSAVFTLRFCDTCWSLTMSFKSFLTPLVHLLVLDQRFAARCEPAGVRRGRRHVPFGRRQNQRPARGLPGAAYKVNVTPM